jgi:hypothetical protein
VTRIICADASGALTALVALLRSLHSSPEVRLEAARALRLLATKADETDVESVAAVAFALGLDASKDGSTERGDFTERCVLEECERLVNENGERARLVNENGERAAAGDVLACVNDGVNDELTELIGATSDPTADVGKVATADLIVSAARPSIDGSIDEAALSGSLPVRVARACIEALYRAAWPGSAALSALDGSVRAQLRLWMVALLGTALPGSSEMDARELLEGLQELDTQVGISL